MVYVWCMCGVCVVKSKSFLSLLFLDLEIYNNNLQIFNGVL